MMPRAYRGVSIEWRPSGWYTAMVLSPTPGVFGPYYVTVHSDTVHGCRRMIADILNGVER